MPNKSSMEHYDAAEKLLEEAESYQTPDTRAEWCLELAKMHLALSRAATAAQAVAAARPAKGASLAEQETELERQSETSKPRQKVSFRSGPSAAAPPDPPSLTRCSANASIRG